MQDTIDLLQIKIERAKAQLSEDTLGAIATVPWQAAILKMRETKGYSFEQLNDLEIETELLLCGLVSSQDYPKELENRMKVSRAEANELVVEMNKEVFSKIKEELIKITERKKMSGKNSPLEEYQAGRGGQNPSTLSLQATPQEGNRHDTTKEEKTNTQVLKSAGIEITNGREKSEIHQILARKLSGPFQIPSVKTEHTLENITKTGVSSPVNTQTDKPRLDPYREVPE